jgi:hypothetical protein
MVQPSSPHDARRDAHKTTGRCSFRQNARASGLLTTSHTPHFPRHRKSGRGENGRRDGRPPPSAHYLYAACGRPVWLVRDATGETDRAPIGGIAMWVINASGRQRSAEMVIGPPSERESACHVF